jgi:uncharacterized membrane protein
VPYVAGIAVLLLAIFALGLVVESRLGPWFTAIVDSLVSRVPLISQAYAFSKRFASIVEAGDNENIMGMTPVWCIFCGEPGASVLALQTSARPVRIGGSELVSIIVPSAPVPVGGALVYVPSSWIKPFSGGVEQLTSVYVSMGVKPPVPTQRQVEADVHAGEVVLPPDNTERTSSA